MGRDPGEVAYALRVVRPQRCCAGGGRVVSHYSIGIDLGTTHCALSYHDLAEAKPRVREESMLPIPQLAAVGTVEERMLLPSFLYLPNAQEFPAGSLALPWDKNPEEVIGEFAR